MTPDMIEEFSNVSKHDVKVGINRLYDFVGDGNFVKGKNEWRLLKRNIIKYYGAKGREYESFIGFFDDGDYLLTRVSIDENQNRMYTVLLGIARMIQGGGEAYVKGEREGILARTKEIYTDLLENYRLISVKAPTNEKVRRECIALSNIMADALMELRNIERAYDQLGDYKLYVKYNAVRRQIGKCESVLPRLIDAFRTAQVKQNFQKEFGTLFERLEDLLTPVQEVNLKDYEDEIIRLFGDGKTLREIAGELNVNVNALAIYMEEHMEVDKLGG